MNKKKSKNVLLKNLFSVFILLFVFSSANAVIYNFNSSAVTNLSSKTILGVESGILKFNALQDTRIYTISQFPMYLRLSSTNNQPLSMEFEYILDVNTTIIKQINLSGNTPFVIEFSPEKINDNAFVTLKSNTADLKYEYIFTNYKIDNQNSYLSGFMGSVKTLIEVNLGFWKIFYYLFIISIIIGSIGLLFSFAFRVYEWSEDLSHSKNEIILGGKK